MTDVKAKVFFLFIYYPLLYFLFFISSLTCTLRTLKGAVLIKRTNGISGGSIDSTEFPRRLLAQPVAKVMCELGFEAAQSLQSVSSQSQVLLCLPP